jgi:hypothetical protein
MLFFNAHPLAVEPPVTACDKFIHPGHTQHMSLRHQPHDGSTIYVFITGETMSLQVLLQGREKMKIVGHQIWTVQCMVHFPTELLQQVSSLLRPKQICKVEEKNHTITQRPGSILLMASQKLYSVLQ